jgi:hypothetical protein
MAQGRADSASIHVRLEAQGHGVAGQAPAHSRYLRPFAFFALSLSSIACQARWRGNWAYVSAHGVTPEGRFAPNKKPVCQSSNCHPRESDDPDPVGIVSAALDPRFREDDGCKLARLSDLHRFHPRRVGQWPVWNSQ